jgi:hypothetical protein
MNPQTDNPFPKALSTIAKLVTHITMGKASTNMERIAEFHFKLTF